MQTWPLRLNSQTTRFIPISLFRSGWLRNQLARLRSRNGSFSYELRIKTWTVEVRMIFLISFLNHPRTKINKTLLGRSEVLQQEIPAESLDLGWNIPAFCLFHPLPVFPNLLFAIYRFQIKNSFLSILKALRCWIPSQCNAADTTAAEKQRISVFLSFKFLSFWNTYS